ncbi:hypothetical protein GCM10022419_108190 [Nonomuraea rosea]|uniref:Secreted protein n=1 Tax=Nonomuraea rosea TaxID=638574 RepID=A0ABP6ZE66_9ACTN
MGKLRITTAIMGLTAFMTVVPTAGATWAESGAAQARISPCNQYKGAHADGKFYAFASVDCGGYLGGDEGNDSDWGQSGGGFSGGDTDKALSILNDGIDVGLHIVAVYDYTAYTSAQGYRCLDVGDWVPDLRPYSFVKPNGSLGVNMARQISSHRWVARSACTDASMIG